LEVARFYQQGTTLGLKPVSALAFDNSNRAFQHCTSAFEVDKKALLCGKFRYYSATTQQAQTGK